MSKWLMLFLLLPPLVCFSEEETEKYKDFELNLIYGVSDLALRRDRNKLPLALSGTISKFFSYPQNKAKSTISTYLQYNANQYIFAGDLWIKDKEILKGISRCDYSKDNKTASSNCGSYVMAVANSDTGLVQRIDTLNMPELSMSGMLFMGGPQGFDAYGCYIGNPFSAADLDLDGKPELFFVGGVGAFGEDSGGKIIQTKLFIYNIKEGINVIFNYELSYENYLEKELTTPTKFQSYTDYYIDKAGNLQIGNIHAGIRRYSKLYFKDFDKNNKLDILVWQREYKSRLKSNPIKGYKLEKVTFKLFEESSSGFIEKSIDDKTAKKYMEEYALTWRKGFPNKNLCSDKGPDDTPLIKNVPKQFIGPYNIYDPVLQK